MTTSAASAGEARPRPEQNERPARPPTASNATPDRSRTTRPTPDREQSERPDSGALKTSARQRFRRRATVSRILCPAPSRSLATAPGDDHSSSPVITGGVVRPTRKPRADHPRTPPYLVLLRAGFSLPLTLQRARCALTAPFQPYLSTDGRRAVCFLCHFPSGHPDRGLPGALPYGVRTFLPACSPRRAHAAVVWLSTAECQISHGGFAPKPPAPPSWGPSAPRRASRGRAVRGLLLQGASPPNPRSALPIVRRRARRVSRPRAKPATRRPTPQYPDRERSERPDLPATHVCAGTTRRSLARYCTARASCRDYCAAYRSPRRSSRCSTPAREACRPERLSRWPP